MNQAITLQPRDDVCRSMGFRSKSLLYNLIGQGLMTPSVSIGKRSVAWPSNEVQKIAAARVAGCSDEEIQELVVALLEERANLKRQILNGEANGN